MDELKLNSSKWGAVDKTTSEGETTTRYPMLVITLQKDSSMVESVISRVNDTGTAKSQEPLKQDTLFCVEFHEYGCVPGAGGRCCAP